MPDSYPSTPQAYSAMSNAISYEALMDQLKDGVCVIDAQGKISFWNHGAERITGYTRAEALGQPYAGGPLQHCDKHGNAPGAENAPHQSVPDNGVTHEFELYLRCKDGSLAPVFTRVSAIANARGDGIGTLEVFSDNSTKVQALERIEELEEIALLCPLTGVGNRRYAEMALANALEEFRRYNWPFGLLFIDIDHFKRVNDDHGHGVGDQVLRMVAHALRDTLRSFDFVGRWGGEEFLVILPNITDDILLRVAERCRMGVEESRFQSGGVGIQVTISAGACMALSGESAEELIKRADALLYRAKAVGRNRVVHDV